MSAEQNAAYFEKEWNDNYMTLVDRTNRKHVKDLIEFTKKKEKEAEPLRERPKPDGDELNRFKALLNAAALQQIENAAGADARKLVEDLIKYADSLVEQLSNS